MGKDDELIVNFMYPKLLGKLDSPDNWFKIANEDYNLVNGKPYLLACLMRIASDDGGWDGLRYHTSHDWLMPVVEAIQKAIVDLGIPNYEGTNGHDYWTDKMREKFWDVDHLYKVIGDCLAWLQQKYGV